MAFGAFTSIPDGGFGNSSPLNADLLSFVGDSTYPTGGTAGFQAKVQALYGQGMEVIAVIPQLCAGYTCVYDKATDKLVCYVAAGTEVPNSTNLSAVTFKVLIITK